MEGGLLPLWRDACCYYYGQLTLAVARERANREALWLANIATRCPPGPASDWQGLCLPSLLVSLEDELCEAQARVLTCAYNYHVSVCLAAAV
jgi:hypothetical protein